LPRHAKPHRLPSNCSHDPRDPRDPRDSTTRKPASFSASFPGVSPFGQASVKTSRRNIVIGKNTCPRNSTETSCSARTRGILQRTRLLPYKDAVIRSAFDSILRIADTAIALIKRNLFALSLSRVSEIEENSFASQAPS
jgi:hypothetical protein